VIVLALVKGIDLREVISDRSDMVSHHVHHNPNSFIVASADQGCEVVS